MPRTSSRPATRSAAAPRERLEPADAGAGAARPMRFVIATPICDGHDVAAVAITRILRREGAQPVYIGFNKTPQQIAKAAVEEDADGVGVSTYNGGHMLFLKDVLSAMAEVGIGDVPLFAGGGGTILAEEVAPLEKAGVAKVYRPPMDLVEACRDMIARAEKSRAERAKAGRSGKGAAGHAHEAAYPTLGLSRRITRAELAGHAEHANGAGGHANGSSVTTNGNGANGSLAAGASAKRASSKSTASTRSTSSTPARIPVWGIGGRGGAGKSTLVDELLFRFLRGSDARLAVVSIDPTLGDRLRMLHCYADRVFLRSVALGPGEDVAARLAPVLDTLRAGPFDLILVESVGLGQNELGVAPYTDHSIYCMTPEYGTNVQLEKEAALSRADIVVMNKRDYPQAEAKARRVRGFLRPEQRFVLTEAKNHADAGVTELFDLVRERAGIARRELPIDAFHVTAATGELLRNDYLGRIVRSHEDYYREMEREVAEVRRDGAKAKPWLERFKKTWARHGFDGDAKGTIEADGVLWREFPVEGAGGGGAKSGKGDAKGAGANASAKPAVERVPVARRTTCGVWVPVLGLPPRDSDPGAIVAYYYKQNLPGEFPYTEGAFTYRRADQDPIRMFAGLGLPETTNRRFHMLMKRGGAPRLSTAFDSLTLYGIDSDEPGAMAKVGEGGVAVDTVEDMERLYEGFDLEDGSVSLTMSGPAPTIMALYLAAARKRGFDWKKLRGTIQTDILKEIQAQNEAIFPLDPSLRLIADMFEFLKAEAPLWYPISISGYHIHEAGANPIQELAFTLANGFTYIELLKARGMDPERFTKQFSFFFTAGSEIEFHAMGRVARRLWAVALDRVYGVKGPGRRLKFHTQTSGRSLQDVEPLHNLARVTIQAERALHNQTNSLHTNSYKETYSTPEEDDVILAMGCQQIPLQESGDFRYLENMNQGAWGLSYLEDAVERSVQEIFREIDRQGGVAPAIENEYFRGMIQEEVMRDQARRHTGEKKIVGVNYLNFGERPRPAGALVEIPITDKRRQIASTGGFKKKHRREAEAALARLQEVARGDGNVFAELTRTMEVATVGQVTKALWEVWGRFRPSM